MRRLFGNLFAEPQQTDSEVTPKLGISMGDPVGIGPEVVTRALGALAHQTDQECVVFGDAGVLRKYASPSQTIIEVSDLSKPLPPQVNGIYVRAVGALRDFEPGAPNSRTDQAQLDYIHTAVDANFDGHVQALVTAPIHKEGIRRAGATWPGHTEMLANLACKAGAPFRHPVMMLAGPSIRTVPVTTHVALKDLGAALTEERIHYCVTVTANALRRYFGISRPRIAVAGLNPHAGEGGLFGREEIDIIQPAIKRASVDLDLPILGPLPGDIVFRQAAKGQFDAVLGMYHDQALIPVKLLDFDHAVNITLGLGLIRTSVDHGTAYDIAGKGKASATSMIEAIRIATKMVRVSQS
jgi:4-hydroxythreonine-4-phosphate dehydrogenase